MMKVKFEIDATPEEWRRFFGMPDVTELHEQLLNDAKEKIASGDYDAVAMMQSFMPEDLKKMADMQKNFWENVFNKKS
ncbi:MAG: hypothetical protein HWE13_00725 [Gammaproteobacteria bacterium]|nr:hypothetical protein [Gammaproteobacteria bacterium]NVK86612.1 hypothetical protein [Gammaproteobacteria bacterium]